MGTGRGILTSFLYRLLLYSRMRSESRVLESESSPTSKRQRNDPSEMWNIDGATMLADAAPVDKDAKEAAAEVIM
jgi:hypothetical protein